VRAVSNDQKAVLNSPSRSNLTRIRIRDATGTIQDYTSRVGRNWGVSATISEDQDSNIKTADVELQRDVYAFSNSPMVVGSPLNNSGAAVDTGSEIWVDVAPLPAIGRQPVSGDWINLFHGLIDDPDFSQPVMKLTCSDLSKVNLADNTMRLALEYGVWAAGQNISQSMVMVPPELLNTTPLQFWRCSTGGTTAGGIWTSGATVISTSGGDFRRPVAPDPQGQQRYFWCVAGGTTGGGEPNWAVAPYGSGGTVSEGVSTTIASGGGGAIGATLHVASTTGFPTSGSLDVSQSGGGHFTVSYTGVTSNTFTGVTGSGTLGANGTQVSETGSGVLWVECAGVNVTPEPNFGTYLPGTVVHENGSATAVWTAVVPVTWPSSTAVTPGFVAYDPALFPAVVNYWVVASISGTGTTFGTVAFPAAPSLGQAYVDNPGPNQVIWVYQPLVGGSLAETLMQNLIDDNVSGVTLYTVPRSNQANSGWYLRWFQNSLEALYEQLKALAIQIGYDIRERWNAGTGDWELTLTYVQRTGGSSVWTLTGIYGDGLKSASRPIDPVCNWIQIDYDDLTIQDPTTGVYGAPQQIIVKDATSIAKYGGPNGVPRRMMIAGVPQIADRATATAFVNAALLDLKEPLVSHEIEVPGLWQLELGDLVTVPAALSASRIYDSDQVLAVVAITHTLKGGTFRTALGLRGTPCAGYQRWHTYVNAQGNTTAPNITQKHAPTGLTIAPTIGGAIVTYDPPLDKREEWDHTEVHVSTAAAFVPGPATLVGGLHKSARAERTGLDPTVLHYATAQHVDRWGRKSNPAAIQSFSPGTALLKHLDPSIRQNAYVYLAADAHGNGGGAGIPSGAIPMVNNNDNGYGLVGYDFAGVWNNTFARWRPTVAGKYVLDYQVEATGMGLGAKLQVVVVAVTLSVGPTQSTVDCSEPEAAIQDTYTGSVVRAFVSQRTTIDITPTMIGNGWVVYWLATIDDASTLLFKAPTSGAYSGSGNEIFAGCKLKITQDLAS
jgi:hypothetical protein